MPGTHTDGASVLPCEAKLCGKISSNEHSPMDWTEQLEALAKKTKAPNWQAPPNEEATKMALVAPFLRAQGTVSRTRFVKN